MNIKSDFFNQIEQNYSKLNGIVKKINYSDLDNKDILNSSIIATYDHICKNGFKGNNYCSYVVLVAKNLIFQESKKSSKFAEIDFDIEEEKTNNNADIVWQDSLKFIEANYTPVDAGLFKFRFYTNKSIIEISKLTGFSKQQVFYRTNKILNDLKKRYGTR